MWIALKNHKKMRSDVVWVIVKINPAKNLWFKTLVTVNKSAIFAALFTRLAHFGR